MSRDQGAQRDESPGTVDVTNAKSLSAFGQSLDARIAQYVSERIRMMQAQGTPMTAKMDEIRAIAKKAQQERAALVSVPPVHRVDIQG